MPYNAIDELPEKIRGVLPEHAQVIYWKAYNNAIKEYVSPEKRRGKNKDSPEKVAHKVAWSAVKKKYKKVGKSGGWVEK